MKASILVLIVAIFLVISQVSIAVSAVQEKRSYTGRGGYFEFGISIEKLSPGASNDTNKATFGYSVGICDLRAPVRSCRVFTPQETVGNVEHSNFGEAWIIDDERMKVGATLYPGWGILSIEGYPTVKVVTEKAKKKAKKA